MSKMGELWQETMADADEPGQGDYCEECGVTGVELVYGDKWCQDCLDEAVNNSDAIYEDNQWGGEE